MDYDDGVKEIKMMKVRLGLCRLLLCWGDDDYHGDDGKIYEG